MGCEIESNKLFIGLQKHHLLVFRGWCHALDHFPEIINDIGQAVGVDDQGDRFAEDDDGHVAFEGHIGQTCQHTNEVGRTNWPDHHEDKEAIEPLAFIEPANVLVIGLLTDHGLDELRPVHSGEMEDNSTADDDADVIVDGPDNMSVDENTCYRCQGAGNNRYHRLENLEQDKKRWPEDSGLQNKGRQGFFGLKDSRKVGPDTESKGCEGSNDGRPINDTLEKRRDLF